MKCDSETITELVFGGAVLGGGGGGAFENGLQLGRLATEIGTPSIISLADLQPDDIVLTVSAVGAPAAEEQYVQPIDYVHSVEMACAALDAPIAALNVNEMGAMASVNGLIQSAVLGIPVVDAPCNGRAHPTAAMGAMGLNKIPDYTSLQAACGGDPACGRRVEILVHGDLARCSILVREASIQAGGVVAVARNPVSAEYLKEHAAVGAMNMAILLGKAILDARQDGQSSEEVIAQQLGGEVLAQGKVTEVELTTRGGFDVGAVQVEHAYELVFWNEFMLLESSGERLYTFPDLITIFSRDLNRPVSSAELRKGMKVVIIAVRKEKLLLGDGMRDRELFLDIEKAIGRQVVHHVFLEG